VAFGFYCYFALSVVTNLVLVLCLPHVLVFLVCFLGPSFVPAAFLCRSVFRAHGRARLCSAHAVCTAAVGVGTCMHVG
jgi:hypothetical protein